MDELREFVIVGGWLMPCQGGVTTSDLTFSKADRDVLRRLAGEVAMLSARPIEDKKRDLWRRHNALEPTRPLVFCSPERSWSELVPLSQLECRATLARRWEAHLRREIFRGVEIKDDCTIEPHFDVSHVYSPIDWGLKEKRIGGEDGGSYCWEAPIKTEEDVEKLHIPKIELDCEATERVAELADEILGDLLNVRVKTSWWWSLGMTWMLVALRGMEQMMYDLFDRPDLIHRLMAILRDGTMALLDYLEEERLLSLNNDGTYIGSGGLGWSDELPQPDFDGKVRLHDMWGFAESQETVGVSPSMFAEFFFPYQLPILERSPWADRATMAEMLGDCYIYSMKTNPTDLSTGTFDEDRIRATLREDLRITRHCRVEVIMKDLITVKNDPQRVIRWVQIAHEEAKNL
jgi:hypothetical protein